MESKVLAERNLLALKENPYPGRGIILGLDETGQYAVQVYWIMGRSENSRNRVFIEEFEGILKTAAADPSKVKDPSLIIYQAMAENYLCHYAVSNGHQTLKVSTVKDLNNLADWTYEPDAPNYTPRISGRFDLLATDENSSLVTEILLLKKSPLSEACDRHLYKLAISTPGLGYCVTTYSGDGDPLPSFAGEPYLLPITGEIEDVIDSIWQNLNEENRVSLAVKFIDIETGKSFLKIINKYKQIG